MKVFVFAGTADGKKFICALLGEAENAGLEITAHVFCATEYGAELVRAEVDKKNIVIHGSRLGENEMAEKIREVKPDYVIDCTHPFAQAVTKNIKTVCESTGVPYLRLRRETSEKPPPGLTVHYAGGMEEAASFLKDKSGNIFLTTGSKDLRYFSGAAFEGRVYPRVLPLEESLRLCREAGVAVKNIIAIQGPFSRELNRALIRRISAVWLVSKETGVEGGLAAKMDAALDENCSMLVIRPPEEGFGSDAETIINVITKKSPLKPPLKSPLKSSVSGGNGKKRGFPAFIDVAGKKFLVVGAGAVALRRIQTLLRFDCSIEIIAREIPAAVKNFRGGRVRMREGVYRDGDCRGDFVIAATDDRGVNRAIGEECRRKNIPVSVADRKEESTFYFPAIVEAGVLTVGLTSDGNDHRAVKEAAREIRVLLGEKAYWRGR